jgi:hypothetical protein
MKKVILIATILMCSFNGFSQSKAESSDKKLKFGFNVGLNYSNLVFDEANFSTWAESQTGFGFQLGVLANYQFSEYFAISPRVNLTFNDAAFAYSSTHNSEDLRIYKIMPLGLESSIYLSARKKISKALPYLFFGPTFKYNLEEQPTTTSRFTTYNTLAIDLGIGLENQFKRFHFSPEIKYSYGLNSINQNPILGLFYLHQISLVFNFLG